MEKTLMKKAVQTLGFLSAILISSVLFANPKASIEWQVTSIDFGKVTFKEPVTAEFIFKNPGLVPLLINDVKSSCGCTVADFPKYPIVSGQEGKIRITFDAESEGFFSKTINVYSNTEGGITQLNIEGIVIK